MSEPTKKRHLSPVPAPGRPATPQRAPADRGRVIHDDRGNAKWDLGLDSTRVNKLTTSQLLKELSVEDLALLDETDEPPPGHQRRERGFEPYQPASDDRKAPKPRR
jgi:hypothetical protein